ncbi:MAG: Type 1 glutamine amidotransferase-like domain-containing protein [Firmicutes bacterium]|nr:Type 1 glutamine amidotransferase-like domain-containing protein [Bacillota bacterium]
MTVFLTSSPFVDGADRAVLSNANGFVDRIREALPPFCRALFVCADPERHDLTCQFGTDMVSAFGDEGIFFSRYAVLDGSDADQAETLVADSDFIVLAGGHVPTQNAFFQSIHLRELLEGFEGVVMGISAGSMNCADQVYVQPEEEGESDPDFRRFAPGLGLTDVNVLPHYQKVRDNILDGRRLFEDITYADSWGHTFFAIPDGSFFYQDDEQLLLFGEGYLIRDGCLEPLTQEGEVLNMAELD